MLAAVDTASGISYQIDLFFVCRWFCPFVSCESLVYVFFVNLMLVDQNLIAIAFLLFSGLFLCHQNACIRFDMICLGV